MPTLQRSGSIRSHRQRSLAALVAAFALVAGCQGSTTTAVPTDGRSTTAPASLPTQPLTTQALPTPTATPSATPRDVGGHWEAAGTMATGREAPHAVLLGAGGVLVVGNDGELGGAVSDDSAKAEVWDPATAAWHTTESLNAPRGDFVAVPLVDGRALVTGGFNQKDQSYSSTYVYGPRAGSESWSKVGLLGTARTAATGAVLPDGRVLVAGGYYRTKPTIGRDAAPETVLAAYHPASLPETASPGPRLADVTPPNVGSALATAELFDPATGSWSATGPLKYARFGAAAVTLADGRILVVGSLGPDRGVAVDERAVDSAEIYDPKTGRFSLAGRLPDIDRSALEKLGVPLPDGDPSAAGNGSLVALKDGGALLVGHAGWWKHQADISRSFRFDPRTGQWREIGRTFAVSWNNPDGQVLETHGVPNLLGAMVAALPDGRVLIAGGGGSYQSTGPASPSTELYDPATDTWTPLPPMPEARAGGAAVILTDGSVLLVGGHTEQPGEQGSERIVLTSAIRFVPSP